jgi:hypothetical protein
LIEPNWTLLFSKRRGRWWVRLLACGRYHHVKALAWLPAVRSWLFYDVKFNGTRLLLAPEADAATHAFVLNYLADCDLVAVPRLPIPKRIAPHAGFWCTLAIKHLVGIRTSAMRPDRLWRDSLAAGARPYAPGPGEAPGRADAMLTFVKDHAQTSVDTIQPSWLDEAAFARQPSKFGGGLRSRLRVLAARAVGKGRGRGPPRPAAASARC